MRRTRKSLRARARRQAHRWETPAHNARDVENRVSFAWLQGYDAARRDMRAERTVSVSGIVDVIIGPISAAGESLKVNGAFIKGGRTRHIVPTSEDRHCLTPGHAFSCLCDKCAPDLKYDDGTPVPAVLRVITLSPYDTFDPYDTKRRP